MKDNYGWGRETRESFFSSEASDAQMEESGECDDCEFGDDAESEDDQLVDDSTDSGGQGGISERMDVKMIVESSKRPDTPNCQALN
jgi:hypothetical protein